MKLLIASPAARGTVEATWKRVPKNLHGRWQAWYALVPDDQELPQDFGEEPNHHWALVAKTGTRTAVSAWFSGDVAREWSRGSGEGAAAPGNYGVGWLDERAGIMYFPRPATNAYDGMIAKIGRPVEGQPDKTPVQPIPRDYLQELNQIGAACGEANDAARREHNAEIGLARARRNKAAACGHEASCNRPACKTRRENADLDLIVELKEIDKVLHDRFVRNRLECIEAARDCAARWNQPVPPFTFRPGSQPVPAVLAGVVR